MYACYAGIVLEESKKSKIVVEVVVLFEVKELAKEQWYKLRCLYRYLARLCM